MAFFELREYRILPGKMDAWVKLFEEEIVPFQQSKGIVYIASFVSEEDPDLFIWIRRFESEEERERLYKAAYEDPHWRNNISPRNGELLIRESIVVRRLLPTPQSIIR